MFKKNVEKLEKRIDDTEKYLKETVNNQLDGGMSTNILCANEQCRHWFNYSDIMGMDDLNRIEPTKDEAKQREQKIRDELNQEKINWYEEGKASFKTGATALTQIDDNDWYGGRALSKPAACRLAGYIDGFIERQHSGITIK